MNTKDLNSHIGVDEGCIGGDKTVIVVGTRIDGVMVIEEITQEEYACIMNECVASVDAYNLWVTQSGEILEKRTKFMKKMRIIAIIWLCIGIPALIVSLAHLYWLMSPK